MKKIIILLSFLFCHFSSNAQITIDSFAVYNTGDIIDSIYLETTSNGQVFNFINLPSEIDICATTYGQVNYKGCETGTQLTLDTMVTFGFYCKKMFVYTVWDTSYTCLLPLNNTLMDSVLYNQCDNWGFDETSLENNITLYPNPTSGILNIESSDVKISAIHLYDQLGRKLKEFGNLEKTIDISDLPEGIFYVEIETEKGTLTKRVVHSSE